MSTFLRAVALILVMLPVAVTAEPVEIEFDAAVQRAREHAPELRAQRAGVSVAAARLQGVRRWRTNPSLAASSGPRIADGGTTIDWMLGLNQPIAPGGRPAARADVEAARYRVEQLEVLDAERETAGRAARAFARLLYWQDRAALAARNLELATEIESVATRRNAAGDVGGLDPQWRCSPALARRPTSLASRRRALTLRPSCAG